MKNLKKGFAVPLLIILFFLIIGGFVYFYLIEKQSKEIQISPLSTETPKTVRLSDADFIATIKNPDATSVEILAKGDINGDGFEDAIVQEVHCGASCGADLQIVFNENDSAVKLFIPPDYSANFEPSYKGSSATKSEVSKISIKNGIISLTGKGLACVKPDSEESCTEEKWNTIKTIDYIFDGSKIIELSSK